MEPHSAPGADTARTSHRSRRVSPRGGSGAQTAWLSLGPASRVLGVDPGTLRRWADAGRIEAFTTPGGHRRFARRALERLAAAPHDPQPQLARLGATPARVSAAYRRSYVARHADEGPTRFVAADQSELASYRHDGRQLVEFLLGYLDAHDEAGRHAAESAAGIVAAEFAHRIAHAGISLTEGVGLFVAGRRPFLSELGGVARRRGLASAQLAALYEAASELLDRLLLVFIEAYRAESTRG